MKKSLASLIVVFFVSVKSQVPYISVFIPGNYLADNRHRIEIRATGTSTVNLSGYLVLTRDYMLRLPSGSAAKASSPLRISKRRSGNDVPEIELTRMPDFLIRFRDRENEGNFVALFDKSRKIIDAFYHGPLPSVPWLPDRDTLITINREYLEFFVPQESNPIWQFISIGDDPAIAFERKDGTWKVTSIAKTGSSSSEYNTLSLRFSEGVVSVRWSTANEKNVKEHIIERSTDQEHFLELDKVPASGNSNALRNYSWYDTEVIPDKTYYYRIRCDIQTESGFSSKIAEVKTTEGPEEFTMDVFSVPHSGGKEINLRFFSRYGQKVRIKVFDSRMREIAILFNDQVPPGSRNLLKIGEGLAQGQYLFIADTETKRFWKRINL